MGRNQQGKWLAGTSGNPGGRPRGPMRRIRILCQEYAEEVVHELIQIALDPNVRPRDRISAASIILDRGLGKATPELPDDDEEPFDQKARILRLMTPQLREHLGLDKLTTPSLQPPEPHTDTAYNLAAIRDPEGP